MILRFLIDPAPGRVCDVECENYAQILWPKQREHDGSTYWEPEPNPCPLGDVGEVLKFTVRGHLVHYVITSIKVAGGPQVAAPELPWEWIVSLTQVQE